MAKEIETFIKLQVKGGAANPAPPVGPALGSKGVNMMEFCKRFNARTQDTPGKLVPVIITVYKDKSFEFELKTVPAAVQLLEASNIKSGSNQRNRTCCFRRFYNWSKCALYKRYVECCDSNSELQRTNF